MQWLETYSLKVPDGRAFRIFVSENGGFHASCLWYEGGRMLKAPTQDGATTIHFEHRTATTPEKALEAIRQWAVKHFGKPVTLATI